MDIGEMQARLSLKAEPVRRPVPPDLSRGMRPGCVFSSKPEADTLENRWALGLEHHTIETEKDRQRESRVP
jgi:hypothetical protein